MFSTYHSRWRLPYNLTIEDTHLSMTYFGNLWLLSLTDPLDINFKYFIDNNYNSKVEISRSFRHPIK